MDKSPDAFRTISEVADWLGTPAHVLRFWESRFSQVKPVKRAGGRRYYRPSDMVLLGGIKKLLHDDGMTIRGVQKLLREHGVRYVASMSPQIEGVDPVEPPRESVGPVPAAPMAEDVPTGAFDKTPVTQEERIIPFSRSDIPAQPDPNALAQTVARDAPVDSALMEESALPDTDDVSTTDAAEALMIETDAPRPPTVESIEPNPAHRATAQNIAAKPEALESPVPEPDLAPAEDTSPAPAQVTFDFGFDSASKADELSTASSLADDAAFEAALQDALATHDADDDVSHEVGSLPKANVELSIETAEPIEEQVAELGGDVSDTFAPETASEIAHLEPDKGTSQDISEPESQQGNSDELSETLKDLQEFEVTLTEPVGDVPQEYPIQNLPTDAISNDLEDDAMGLDVPEGVLGRLNKNALASDPQQVQAIFNRVTALKARLSRTG